VSYRNGRGNAEDTVARRRHPVVWAANIFRGDSFVHGLLTLPIAW
jgi:hypothetical protein